MKTQSPNKPELLAPAGSIESFHAAIEGGADAVYLGLNDFNARLRANNFSMKALSYLVPFAHVRRVKLYVTLNTLIKQAELGPLIHTLYQLEQIGVDAIIAADFGLIDIARTFFPKLKLHASTQMTIHNSTGLRQAEKLGLRRAILSRELTLQEIASLCKTTSVELELFVHGALCYGISGLCLASSYLGGSSGNRGRCTQVCRRKFKTAGGSGYLFSPDDLCALDFLPQINACGAIQSLKIEGRMKGPDYVFTVVKAYRMALDDPEKLPEAKELAAHDFGRHKTSFFLNGLRTPGIIDASRPSGTGELIGKIRELRQNAIVVASKATLLANDRIRIQPHNGFEGETGMVLHAATDETGIAIVLKKTVPCSTGDTVYLIGRRGNSSRSDLRCNTGGSVPVAFKPECPFINKVIASYSAAQRLITAPRRDILWIKIDDVSWLDHLHATPCQRIVLACGRQEMASLLEDAARLKSCRSRLVPSLPPFIPEHELGSWRVTIDCFKKAGIETWSCSNIGHPLLFDKGFTLIADAAIACLNRASQKAILSQRFSFFTYSYEDDYLNIKPCGSERGIACLYTTVPLFISRIHPAIKPGEPLCDHHHNRFITSPAHGLHYLLAQKPFCLTHRRKKLSGIGIRNFIIDLCFRNVDPGFLQTLIDCYRNGTRLPDSGVFNFKAGLK